MHGPRTALAFLTRLPGGRHPETESELTASVPWFPVIGVVIGALGGLVYWGAVELVAPLAAAGLALAVTALVTGGFHEDGLADSFDALAGGATRERRLEILKDSRHGTFGVLALVVITLVKAGALSSLGGLDGVAALVVAHSLGRAAAVGLMVAAPVATTSGLGADYTRALSPIAGSFGVVVGVAAAGLVFGLFAPVVVAIVAATTAAVGWWAHRTIGGVTGDLLGAAEQVGEAVVLLAASALLV